MRLPELLRNGPRFISGTRTFSSDWPPFDAASEKLLYVLGCVCKMVDIIDDPGEREAADGVADLAALRSHCSNNFKSSFSSGPARVYDSEKA